MTENLQNSNPSANPAPQNPAENPTPIITTEFLKGTETIDKDTLYADLFQKNTDGNLVRKNAERRSPLEIVTTIFNFVMPIAVTLAIVGGVHSLIRSQEDNALAENFQFLCGYLHSGINTNDPAYSCQTAKYIYNDIREKTVKLEKDIVEQLFTYIPIKVSIGAAAASSNENSKAKEVYESKVNFNDIVTQFDKIRKTAQSAGLNNIQCQTVSISANNTLTTQCTIFGGEIGANDTRQLGSSRIETVRFLERLSDTQTSQFILQSPPTTLPVEAIEPGGNIPAIYKTKTTVTISLTYLPLNSQI